MQLLLLRHGQAEDSSPGGDFMRRLVEKGHEQAGQAARVLGAANLLPDLVLTSPYLRARQTADAFTQVAGMPGAVIQQWLGCGMDPESALAELSAFNDFECVMIVGHEPDFSTLIRHCLGTSAGVEVRKGSITCIELRPPSARATLRFLLPFKLSQHL